MVKNDKWCKEAKITTGADYGLHWIAHCFRVPFDPLPFLFFFGNQDCGKSILHEAFALLVTGGVVSADRALTNNNFNGELANGVLAYVEEKNISGSTNAYNRIKDWVTSPVIWIRKMRTDAYPQPNTLHFVMCANEQEACPVIPGDTRITMIRVADLEEDIPKPILRKLLEEEASHFMHTLMNVEFSTPEGRLYLPILATGDKDAQALKNHPEGFFISKYVKVRKGATLAKREVYDRYEAWARENEVKSILDNRVFGGRIVDWFSRKILGPGKSPPKALYQGERYDAYVGIELVSKEGAPPFPMVDGVLSPLDVPAVPMT